MFEVFQRMSDPPVEVCEVCGAGPVERVLYPVAVHFKGSGFYTTDYGKGSGRGGKSSSGSESSGDSSSSSSGSESSSGSDSGGGGGDGGGGDKPAVKKIAEA